MKTLLTTLCALFYISHVTKANKDDCKAIDDRQRVMACITNGCVAAHELCAKGEEEEDVFRKCAERTVDCSKQSSIDYEREVFDELDIQYNKNMDYGKFCAHYDEIFIFRDCLEESCKQQMEDCDNNKLEDPDFTECLLKIHKCQKPPEKKLTTTTNKP